MRTEGLQFFSYGVLLVVVAMTLTLAIPSSLLRLHVRAPLLALGLGFIFIPGHGEFIVIPLLGMFKPPVHNELLAIGGVFFLIWWAIAMLLLLALRVTIASLRRAR